MKALVTGSAGFVGRYLIKHLKDKGDEVSGTDISSGGPDLLDLKGFTELFERIEPEVVFHLAGQADVAASWEDPYKTFKSNVEGTINVLTAARESNVQKIITVTSADVYGSVNPQELPITEDEALKPVSPYAVSKAAAELFSLQAHDGYGQHVIRARAFNHIGPGQSKNFVSAAIACRVAKNELSGEKVVKIGNLEAKRDFTDVRDVVAAYRLLSLSGENGEVYNVCSGSAVSVQEIAERIIGMAKYKMTLEVDERLFRPVEIPELFGDFSKLAKTTQWAPIYPLEETLRDLIEYWRAQVLIEQKAD
ncbi:MAG: GDP-6-deoxy-D-mannose reductase [Acidimicrobiaceae bacterium]|nr:MAG: GDP-6-deoxy-D-mannose reductase [Acidimicrobiaceae bacterium]